MSDSVHYINLFVGLGAIALQILSVAAILMFLIGPKENKFLGFIKEKYLLIGFIISILATAFSLFYSQVLGFAPCYLCWWQRIFIFPQLILFGIAYFKNDRSVWAYSMLLLIIGFVVSLYHNFIYYFGEGSGPCDASGISCVQKLVDELGGYISIPMLSLTTFFALIVLLLIARFYKKDTL